ncbi:MAG: 2-phospho-L-lactate guanylyltransferase [Anaerolineae bacterium]|nr:2-phospho-L-lactate guanylyltransferase [Anaerolineae bacterium]
MRIWAIVPMKPFQRAKSRLATLLTPEQREALAEKFYRHTLETLRQVKELAGVLVISRDAGVLAIAREYRAYTVHESGQPELNAALMRASQVVGAQGADGVIILPADLPLLTPEDVRTMLDMGRYHQMIVIAPDRQREGTNALLLIPPNVIRVSYGVGSFERHQQLALEVGATIDIYHSERMSLDVDLPADLELYYQIEADSAAPEAAAGK